MRTQKFDFKSLLDFLTHLFTVLFGGAKKAAKFTGSAAVHVAEDVRHRRRRRRRGRRLDRHQSA